MHLAAKFCSAQVLISLLLLVVRHLVRRGFDVGLLVLVDSCFNIRDAPGTRAASRLMMVSLLSPGQVQPLKCCGGGWVGKEGGDGDQKSRRMRVTERKYF